MYTFADLKTYFQEQGYKIIIAADGETRTHEKKGTQTILRMPAGGVSVAFDTLAQAANATYIARAKTKEDQKAVDSHGKVLVEGEKGEYTLKRLFLSDEDLMNYYYGFANQTLWPLCHVAFEKPIFRDEWYQGYTRVNRQFAKAIKEEIKGKTFIWINDYQLSLVPAFLGRQKNVAVGFFWHIPWPTWEVFRILPFKRDILWSLLSCDFLGFHRGYQVRNFISTVEHELEVRLDRERDKIYFDKNALVVKNLPMGLDTEIIKSLVEPVAEEDFLSIVVKELLGTQRGGTSKQKKEDLLSELFSKYQVILGVDRLDYTKGLPQRLLALDLFLEQNPKYIGRVLYLGICAPSRDTIPSYKALRAEVEQLVRAINRKYQKDSWVPLHLIYKPYGREDIINFYQKASLCLVTPLDDGMNLVSKEFVTAASLAKNPGMLVLSQFAGSAIDLDQALIVNPYDSQAVAGAIKKGLSMSVAEKKERIEQMVEKLDEHNIYEWANQFVKQTLQANRENAKSINS